MKCPICENQTGNKQECNVCGWEFSYFVEKPSEKEKQINQEKIKKYKQKYLEHIKITEKKYETLSEKLLEKDKFTTTEENRKRIQNLGFVKIGKIEFYDYNADEELLYILVRQLEGLNFKDTIPKEEIALKMEPSTARILFNDTQEYDLLAKIDYVDNFIIIKEIQFMNHSLLIAIKEKIEEERKAEEAEQRATRLEELAQKRSLWWKIPLGFIGAVLLLYILYFVGGYLLISLWHMITYTWWTITITVILFLFSIWINYDKL